MKWATELFGPILRTRDGGETKPSEALAGSKYVLLYVSAHWCPPCRKLTPVLVDMYEELEAHCEDQSVPLEIPIVFASADHTEDKYDEYFDEMPWFAIPFESDARESLVEAYRGDGIPRLVLFESATGSIVDDNARSRIIKSRGLVGLMA
jgi:nucleoredoxin